MTDNINHNPEQIARDRIDQILLDAEYANAKLKYLDNDPFPLVYESTGIVTRFTDYSDSKSRGMMEEIINELLTA